MNVKTWLCKQLHRKTIMNAGYALSDKLLHAPVGTFDLSAGVHFRLITEG